MAFVETVCGRVDADALGFVLVHEHVAISAAGMLRSWPELFGGRDHLLDLTSSMLRTAKAAGVDTLVDATTFDLGRDAELLVEASRRSGVNIIASTGHWLAPSVAMAARSTEQLTQLFIRELTAGMDGTTSRAGAIKVASQEVVSEFEERVLVAAAGAAQATGAPILTHTSARNRTGEQQAAILERRYVDPARVMIGHSDDSPELDYLAGLATRGYWIGMDRIPSGALEEYGPQSVSDRLKMIVKLVELGHAERLLLSHDEPLWAGLLSENDQRRHREGVPDSICYLPRRGLPALREFGLTEDVLTQLTVTNPRQWLAGAHS